MKERPIIFTGESVRWILAGVKTQTRRIVKPQPWAHPDTGEMWLAEHKLADVLADRVGACKYKSGDQLWLRETFCDNGGGEYEYKATSLSVAGSWSSPMHMPRQASRITLEITNVRVERLQEITDEDIVAEGIASKPAGEVGRAAFRSAWDRINGKKALFKSNPWCWVIEFRRVKP